MRPECDFKIYCLCDSRAVSSHGLKNEYNTMCTTLVLKNNIIIIICTTFSVLVALILHRGLKARFITCLTRALFCVMALTTSIYTMFTTLGLKNEYIHHILSVLVALQD